MAVAALGTGVGGASAAADVKQQITAENKLEKQILVALNAVRRAHGLAPLKRSGGLSAAADAQSRAMATHGFFGHESPSGRDLTERVRPHYGRGDKWVVGENLFFSSPPLEAGMTMNAWLESGVHRRNILAPTWREIGLSAVSASAPPGVFEGEPVVIVTATFGVRW